MGMELRPVRAESGVRDGRYEVSVRLSVRDPGQLWRKAAAHMLGRGCSEQDIEEMFGPMEDPSVADCIAALLDPCALAGCSFDEFSVAPAGVARRSGPPFPSVIR